MSSKFTLDCKVYAAAPDRKLSVLDLLDYFSQVGPMRASDLHIKVNNPPIYRVDGLLQKMKGPPLDTQTVRALTESLLTDTELHGLKEHGSVDSSCTTEKMQFRLNCFRDNDGLAIAIRALEAAPPPIESLGFPNAVWRDIIQKQQGLILVTGITGAGKSTTIASMIDRIAQTRACRIITLEDPVEYRLKSGAALISQREVGRDVPSYERGLRDCLREDPDVIFVGEMRDLDTISMALTTAEMGALVFGTLHTVSAAKTVNRIIDVFSFEERNRIRALLAEALTGVVAQQLVKRADNKGRVAVAEMGRFYGMPTWGYAGDSDSCAPDEQAAAEATISIFVALLAGNNLTHDVGYLEQGMTFSPEMMVMSAEIIRELRQFMEGISFDKESMAMEVIHQVGPGQDHLTTDHTLKHFRVLWEPMLFTRLRHDQWKERGGKRMMERVREQTIALLDSYQHKPLPDHAQEEIAYILKEGEKVGR